MNLYLKAPGGHRPAHDADVKRLFGLDPKAKWPANGLESREIQGILCWVNPLRFDPGRPFQRAYARCPSCDRHVPIGRLPQHATVHGDRTGVYKRRASDAVRELGAWI